MLIGTEKTSATNQIFRGSLKSQKLRSQKICDLILWFDDHKFVIFVICDLNGWNLLWSWWFAMNHKITKMWFDFVICDFVISDLWFCDFRRFEITKSWEEASHFFCLLLCPSKSITSNALVNDNLPRQWTRITQPPVPIAYRQPSKHVLFGGIAFGQTSH